MKKTSYYVIGVVGIGILISSFWVYQKYFKNEGDNFLTFKVERGDIQEIVKARGEVAAIKDINLEFPFSGTAEKIFSEEGGQIFKGAPIIKLETINFELEIKKLEATLSQNKANLNKLLAGATKEDISVYENKVLSAQANLEDAKKNIVDKIQDAYAKSDDAIRNKVDQIFTNPRTSSPQLIFSINDFQLETNVEWERTISENTLNSWKSSLDAISAGGDLNSFSAEAKTNLNKISSFLDKAALAINSTITSSVSSATLTTWRTDIATARTNINTAISNLTAAEEKLKTAQSNLEISESELAAKKAPTRSEDIEIAQAQIKEIESQIEITKEKIRKSTLYAPISAKITKIWLEKGELFSVGKTAISLSSSGYKIQSDISELDIGKIKSQNGNKAIIQLDAFPNEKFEGEILSVDPQEINKDGDIYYRVNINFKDQPENIRQGMSADIIISSAFKKNILKIPQFAVYQKNDKKFVKILDGKIQKEIEVKTGISDGEAIEITEGLSEGQIIVVSAE
ncbi:efflux RND transporter periplasmic adaptor subunit [Candidatus Wolfebacteria bacterium]|nr:efflux RND transporter periplasmic adaptor subunit [Candidatus Wolfebacteria bacterium]